MNKQIEEICWNKLSFLIKKYEFDELVKELSQLITKSNEEAARVTAEEVIEKIRLSLQANVSNQMYSCYVNYDEDINTNIRNNMRGIARGIRRVKSTMKNMLSGKFQKKPLTYLAGSVGTIKQSSAEAGEHQTPKPNGTVDKTYTINRQYISNSCEVCGLPINLCQGVHFG